VDALEVVDAEPTAMHESGDGHEIAESPGLVPVGTTGCHEDHAVPFQTSPMTRGSMR
jgi:hypothetical protein